MPGTVRSEESKKSQPVKYEMGLISVLEGEKTEYLFTVGRRGYKSLDALKGFIANMPKGSTLEWNPGCIRSGGEPLLSSEKDMQEFKEFCKNHQINFVLVPSG